jgi:protein-tyrosine-phosphatase
LRPNPKELYIRLAGLDLYIIGHKPDSRSTATAKNYNIDIKSKKPDNLQTQTLICLTTFYVMDKPTIIILNLLKIKTKG